VEFLVKSWGRHLALMCMCLLVFPVQAKQGDTFRPFVSYTRYYDSNLFRLAENGTTFVVEDGVPEIVTTDSGSDQYSVATAGLNVDWRPGRQQIQGSVSKSLVRFSRYASLDYDGSDQQLQWNWQLGNHWRGRIGTTEKVTQTNFADLTLGGGLQAINNQISARNDFFSATWQLHPRWSLEAGVEDVQVSNSTVQREELDYENAITSVTLGYDTPKGGRLSAQFRKTDGEYPNRSPALMQDRAYSQTELSLLADWNFGGKLITHLRLGRIERETGAGQNGSSNLAGRLSADYFATAKTIMNLAVYRELSNSDDLNASTQLRTGTSLGATWLATSKLNVNAGLTFENRSLQDDAGSSQRDEDTLNGSVSLSYAFLPQAALNLGIQAGRRDSTEDVLVTNDFSYSFHSVSVSLQASF
jgi:exopolysaccharide biosynthesis operon protein EpsL